MLDACANADTLDAFGEARREHARKVRVFGIIFKVTTAKRIALNVHARAEQNVDAMGFALRAQETAILFQ